MTYECGCPPSKHSDVLDVLACVVKQRDQWRDWHDRATSHHETMRDRFAMAAFHAFQREAGVVVSALRERNEVEASNHATVLAQTAYEIADAMLDARERKP